MIRSVPSYMVRQKPSLRLRLSSNVMLPDERQQAYQEHRHRVQNAKSIVNSQAPARKIKEDDRKKALAYMQMFASTRPLLDIGHTFSKAPQTVHVQRIGVANKQANRRNSLGSSRLHFRPSTGANVGGGSGGGYNSSAVSAAGGDCDVPPHILQRYERMTFYTDMDLLQKVLRPKIYIDLFLRDAQPLGRLVIQLYTEACPEVVHEFVRACTHGKHDRLKLTRLFPPMWLEGELKLLDQHALTETNIDHDLNALDHGSGPGILSFPSRYVRGSKRRTLNFSISFQPFHVLNGKRVAFGRVRKGMQLLDAVQEFAGSDGRRLKRIDIVDCGLTN